ncbi:hypothetical protein MRX96_028018 [Rhipicephalus microplus]
MVRVGFKGVASTGGLSATPVNRHTQNRAAWAIVPVSGPLLRQKTTCRRDVLNRRPPFGSRVVLAARRIPNYELDIMQDYSRGDQATLSILVRLRPLEEGNESERQTLDLASAHLIIGDADDRLLFYQRLQVSHLVDGWARRISLRRAGSGDPLTICLVSSKHVGVDVRRNFVPRYTAEKITLLSPWTGKVEDAEFGKLTTVAPSKVSHSSRVTSPGE